MTAEPHFDPKGLIRESFAIEGITAPECRSIFLDWALGLPQERDVRIEVQKLIAHYAPLVPDRHPMLETLRAALHEPATPRRRGGRSGRF
ncbi:hypothetical protein [Yoonia sp.]|uniref:hypothetical protein n=1 Tax=Yoonia sp. TaxID=2212373 RepID=UPI003975515F